MLCTLLQLHQVGLAARLIQLALADGPLEAPSGAAKRSEGAAEASTAVAGECWRCR
jgi:hypothetical protein